MIFFLGKYINRSFCTILYNNISYVIQEKKVEKNTVRKKN